MLEKSYNNSCTKTLYERPTCTNRIQGYIFTLTYWQNLFTNITNITKVVSYWEEIGLFCDEQNGFHHSVSCEVHIFSLTIIIRNRLKFKRDTYVAFIDMQKAFDWVNRDLLWYKLLVHNITGKIYWAIKSLYEHNISCVKLHGLLSEWFNVDIGVR